MSTNELGALLRSRREAITPAEVGLPTGSRRRTPGLRRTEVATLAGVSVEYLTRLEQGRDRHPSAQVLAALADALQLSGDDRTLLRRAAKANGGMFCAAAVAEPSREVRPGVRALLELLDSAIAVVLNRLGDVLDSTAAFERLAAPLGILDSEPANLVRYVFADPRSRAAFPDWDHAADTVIADLKARSMHTDQHLAELASELMVTAGAAFRERFESPPPTPSPTGTQRVVHPHVGELRLTYETLDLPDSDQQRIVVYLPGDAATSAALDRLAERQPRALRAVSG